MLLSGMCFGRDIWSPTLEALLYIIRPTQHSTKKQKRKEKKTDINWNKKIKEHKGDRMRISFFFLFFRNRLPFEPYKIIHMHKVVSCMIYNHLNSEMT